VSSYLPRASRTRKLAEEGKLLRMEGDIAGGVVERQKHITTRAL
jgi:hypothetical protein